MQVCTLVPELICLGLDRRTLVQDRITRGELRVENHVVFLLRARNPRFGDRLYRWNCCKALDCARHGSMPSVPTTQAWSLIKSAVNRFPYQPWNMLR